MTGSLTIVGLGPGNAGQLTPEAASALTQADVLYGYASYLARVPEQPGQLREASDNGAELSRAAAALDRALTGENVAMVSGGDPGVFAMAAAVCEAIETGPEHWRQVDLLVLPGVTAMLAVAARVGAPLGHDFCAINLSDNLKPWPVIERRLAAAASAGFVIALYNPVSRARPWQLAAAFDLLRQHLPDATPIVLGRAIGRKDEQVTITQLAEVNADAADMATCVLIGSAETRIVKRAGREPLVYTPRSVRPEP